MSTPETVSFSVLTTAALNARPTRPLHASRAAVAVGSAVESQKRCCSTRRAVRIGVLTLLYLLQPVAQFSLCLKTEHQRILPIPRNVFVASSQNVPDTVVLRYFTRRAHHTPRS